MESIQKGRITVDFASAKKVKPVKYGWHYEEIGMIGDGGLYAEMIRNRDFAESGTAPGLKVENGAYADIPPSPSPTTIPEILPDLNCWEVYKTDQITIFRVTRDAKDRRYEMKIISKSAPSGLCGVLNTGFFGMSIRKGARYNLTLYLKSDDMTDVCVGIADHNGYVSDCVNIGPLDQTCRKYTITLTGSADTDEAFFLLTPLSAGTVTLRFASLFPADTWNGGKSVFRSDIVQNMKDFEPEFLRFPGGCIVHGVNVETMYHWKETIGDIAQRKSSWSKWQPHFMSNGIGYHEFYELCEYLGAEAMYVAPSGLVCTEWVHQKGLSDDHSHPEVDVNDYIQDCLDAIEYAIGSVDSEWGAKRAENGHPSPFPLTYVSVGNEDFGPQYYRHYDAFYHAIKDKYPQLKIIANSIIGNRSHLDWDDKRKRLKEFIDLSTVEIFDEHCYETGDWVFENFSRYDEYDRNGPDLMCLELGLESNQPSDILYESVYLMMFEKNGDLNPVFAGRPLMRNWTFVKGALNPFYYHTNAKSWKTIHFHAKKLFRDNRFDLYYPSKYCKADGSCGLDVDTLFTTVGTDTASGDLVLKVVNLSGHPTEALIDIGVQTAKAQITTLINTPVLPTTPEESERPAPAAVIKELDFAKMYSFAAQSLTVMRIKSN